MDGLDPPKLLQNLKGWQIFFIVITLVVGSGIFNNGGSAVEIAGPGGALVALSIMGVITICMAECLSELTQLFPAPNAIVAYVQAFIDKDLGWVIGIAYWFTYSSIFAVQNLTAANLAAYWELQQTWQIMCFFIVEPFAIVAINCIGVSTFGWIETIGGVLKIGLVAGTTVALYVMAADKANWSEGPVHSGFKYDPDFVSNRYTALCYVIPIVAFGFLGIEGVAVTAFEANSSSSLRRPSQIIAYATFMLYLLYMIGQCLNVPWTSPHLPTIYGGIGDSSTDTISHKNPSSSSMAVIAFWEWGRKPLAGFVNGAMLFSVLSASNTSLYMASRTLYGLARAANTSSSFGRAFHSLSIIEPKTGVPNRAVWFSAFAFFWLPLMSLAHGYAVQHVIEIIQISASVSCLIVWAAISLAYLRYFLWLKKCDRNIPPESDEYRRHSKNYRSYTVLSNLQPIPGIVSLVGCFVVLVFCSSTWWNTPITVSKVMSGYAAPVILITLFIFLKLFSSNPRSWVRTSNKFENLDKTLKKLAWLKPDEETGNAATQLPASLIEPHNVLTAENID